MAGGINTRDRSLDRILRAVYDRIRRLERPISIHLGPIGGTVGNPTSAGFTISVDSSNRLVATSDSGTITILALQ